MDTNIKDTNIFSKINKIYNTKGFLDKYGLDIWTAVIICLVFFVITSYFYVLNNIEPIVADWENQKCSPAIMPFAGLINKGPNDSAFDFTGKNFTGCVQGILTNIIAYAFQPIYYIMKNITDAFSELLGALNSIRAVFDRIRKTIDEFSTETMGRTMNITMPIVQMLIAIKSMGGKMVGTLTASLYTLIGSYTTLQSFFLLIIELITTIIIILGVIIAGLIVANFFAFGALSPVIALNTAILIAITIPMVLIHIFVSNILALSADSMMAVPSCFSKQTMIDVRSNDCVSVKKSIADIEVGDVLKYGEKVTAIMKFSAKDQILYEIDRVKITGEHRLFHKELGWIKAKAHPNRILLPEFNEPFVYCLGTHTKTFALEHIPGHIQIYSDWDDIDEDILNSLYFALPNNFSNKDIHAYLDNGIIGSSVLELQNGNKINISDVKINDTLVNGEKVLGIIKIDAVDLKNMYEYKYKDKTICGFNVSLDTNEIDTNEIDTNEIELPREKYLYQLLTDTGVFYVNGIQIRDYNYGIDKYML
uniref:Vint domain-containing protein n=1 Tax=viral metagenome TaxID=1070528 RepID=A0A6C0IJ35_9ZZZZ